ncbi:MAG: hypothetical protein QOD98_2071 [Nocardioidaceae bacterium]|nr:hypothetical protein [Nocardioidaceae bacterium]
MSDQPDAGSLPELTPEQESEVRRLLAEARHDEPVPTDVADRLDTVLAGLSRDEPGAAGLAPVIDLAARRRRRNAAALLAGAAAVIVAGFAIGQVIDPTSSSNDTAGSSADTADRAGGAGEKAQASSPSLDGSSVNPPATAPLPLNPQVLRLTSKHLARDLNDQLMSYSAASSDAVRGPTGTTFSAVGCTQPAPSNKFGLGDFFPALYDHTPAVLALRAPADGRQRADVLDCGTADLLATVTIAPR